MPARVKHERPSDRRIAALVRRIKKLLKAEPDDVSSGYRRGLAEALTWVIGENPTFDRNVKWRNAKS